MEAGGAGIGRLDCYEDMFKEITRKLYGEDPDHRSEYLFLALFFDFFFLLTCPFFRTSFGWV